MAGITVTITYYDITHYLLLVSANFTARYRLTILNYTVGEKELLGIVEGLKAFAGVIRGQDLTVQY